jgi:CheY-like chemotaxis protein
MSACPEMPDDTARTELAILLAEEQTAARDLVKLVLGRLHFRIECVTSGGEALARARRAAPDLVLLSTTLPDMPGASLIDALRQLPGLQRVPMVALHQPGHDVRDLCLAAGAAACLGRPLEIDRLLRLIERLVRRPPQAGVATTEPVLDLGHLRHMTDGDAQLEGELIALFLSTSELYLETMREALHAGRPWSATAHALKGASANLGARRVATLALVAERSAPSLGQLEAIEQALGELRAVVGGERTAA